MAWLISATVVYPALGIYIDPYVSTAPHNTLHVERLAGGGGERDCAQQPTSPHSTVCVSARQPLAGCASRMSCAGWLRKNRKARQTERLGGWLKGMAAGLQGCSGKQSQTTRRAREAQGARLFGRTSLGHAGRDRHPSGIDHHKIAMAEGGFPFSPNRIGPFTRQRYFL